ncbi:MAG TPA: MFS transporter [Candidatus Acidoferrales bacterium]|nr:MFS transporter [Candidatus Acidoferrales bacterium]
MADDSSTEITEQSTNGGVEPGARISRWSVMFRALKYRNFQLFFAGQLISLVGTWMDNIAEAWLVYRLTGSSLLLGTVAFAGQIPVFLLAPIGGLVADRLDRRRVVIVTQTLSMIIAGALAGLTLSGRVKVWEVMVLASLMGVVNAFDIPARQAFLAEMVGREDLMNAIALNSSMFNGARVVGPAIAGILVASIGEGWCFFANSVSYIAVIAGLLMMRIVPRVLEERRASAFEHIAEGFRFVRRTGPILALLLLLGLVSLVAMPYSVLMPIFAARILHGNATTLGTLMGATGIGALTGALVLASRTGLKGLSRWVAMSCGGFGIALILFSFSRWYVLSVILLVPVGFMMMVQMASSNTLIQAMVPDRLRGRTMAVYSMMFMGMAPLGSLLSGALAGRIGAPWTVAVGGTGAIIGAIVFARFLPKLRVEARELIIAQGLAGGEPAGGMTSRALE